MSWWNSWGDTGQRLFAPFNNLQGDQTNAPYWDVGARLSADPGAAAEAQRKQNLYGQAAAAGNTADQSQQAFNAYGQQGNAALGQLQGIASGQNSVSALQLQQALGQNLAAQRSLAAGASPQNSAMAARTASIQSARLGGGLAGQQAVAGLQERNQAWNQYGGLLQGLRGQDLQNALGSRQAAITGYGAQDAGAPEKGPIDKYGSAVVGGLGAIFGMSDRRTKRDIRDGEDAANEATSKMPAFIFHYKDPKHGAGKQVGVMAQDLERAGLGHAVVDTPAGKMVHGAKLATANTAMISAMGRRLARLEGKED